MNKIYEAPWHKESYVDFLLHRLPELLAERVPLEQYEVHPPESQQYACRVELTVAGWPLVYDEIPYPDEEGCFFVGEALYVVTPMIPNEHLDQVDVLCAGEQALEYIASRLGCAARDLPWDEHLLRLWLPLDQWLHEFLKNGGGQGLCQRLDTINWLARKANLRRIRVLKPGDVIAPSHQGRTCLYETPEGPNVGRYLSLATGAAIKGGRILPAGADPCESLGLTALMVPCIEHDDPNRVLMGVNMMRQWLTPLQPESALVQTGYEPNAQGFWCGRNLLTAYMPLGVDTHEDALVISRSAAERLAYPTVLTPGDKLSNRHGTKGVISRISPDDEMPRLPDGTPVDLVFGSSGLHTRMNHGQLREAVLGRIARAQGQPVIAEPFSAPRDAELHALLKSAGLPESGMEHMRLDGAVLPFATTVGWVYWGKTRHVAAQKLRATGAEGENGQKLGELEYQAMKEAGAFINIREAFGPRAAGWTGEANLSFTELAGALRVAGISAHLGEGVLTFAFLEQEEDSLVLAAPIPHPWLPERMMKWVGRRPGALFTQLEEVNTKLTRLLAGQAPPALMVKSMEHLKELVASYLDGAVTSACMRVSANSLFSAHAVITPASGLRYDQIGLPDEIAWTLFAPLAGVVGVERGPDAWARIDAAMADRWVIGLRPPVTIPMAMTAFRPVRVPGCVIRVHTLSLMFFNADFDGDELSVMLPITPESQREAREKLSMAGHLRRDPELTRWLGLNMESAWAWAMLSRTGDGLTELRRILGRDIIPRATYVTRDELLEELKRIVIERGPEEALTVAESLLWRGFEYARTSGASLSPFAAEGVAKPGWPDSGRNEDWERHTHIVEERLASSVDYDNSLLGPQLIYVKSGARGNMSQLAVLTGTWRLIQNAARELVPVRHGWAEGRPTHEAFQCAAGARRGLGDLSTELMRQIYGLRKQRQSMAFTVLARAMRAPRPGAVFAQAAATGEIDPLTDLDSRLFVGLAPEG